jgi:hypothetical protein
VKPTNFAAIVLVALFSPHLACAGFTL